MQIKNCLITAAGLGTRMGKLGEVTPKPLWPIFERRLLDVQLKYIQRFSPENIFVNSHHCSDQVLAWAKENNVTVLDEPILLGSGGCVHNLKKYLNSTENEITCIVNSDQFFMLSETHIKKGINKIKNGMDMVIYGMNVDKDQKYNETFSINNKLVEIRKNNGVDSYYTYSGVCLINLNNLKYVEGESSFFQTVCNYKENKNIYFYDETKDVEFWDFGEKEKYVQSLLNLLENNGVFKDLMLKSNALNENAKYYDEKSTVLRSGEMEINTRERTIKMNGLIDQY